MRRTEPRGLRRRWAPTAAQIVVLSFLAAIALGAAVLAHPVCHTGARHAFLDDLFTATSAVCVTGLATVDVSRTYTPVGHAVLIALMELGGLGYMTLFSIGLMLAGKRLSLRDRLNLQEATEQPGLEGLLAHVSGIIRLMLAAEALGAAVLATQTVPEFGWGRGLFVAVFFAVASPTNSGFSVFPDNVMRWQHNPVVLLTLVALLVFGGLGYNVLRELMNRYVWRKPPQVRWNPLIRIVLWTTLVLLVVPTVALWWLEHRNPLTLGAMGASDQWLNALFTAAQTRTAGFNSVDIAAMTRPSQLLMVPLMFVGTGPGGTGGGLKITTLVVLLATVAAAVRGSEDVVMPFLRRRVSPDVARKAVAAMMLSVLLLATVVTLIADVEAFPLLDIIFEVTSAFGTAGLSLGITPRLHDSSKLLLIVTMFAGRVGLLTLALAMVPNPHRTTVRYAEEPLLVG